MNTTELIVVLMAAVAIAIIGQRVSHGVETGKACDAYDFRTLSVACRQSNLSLA